MIGTEDEVAKRVKAFQEQGVDRLIISPVQADPAERMHTIERMSQLVGAGAAA